MKKAAFVFLVFYLISCRETEIVVPDDVMPKDSMALLITEMHLVEAAITSQKATHSPDSIVVYPYYKSMLEQHKASLEYFERSYDFYLKHPQLMAEVYELVMEDLSTREAQLK